MESKGTLGSTSPKIIMLGDGFVGKSSLLYQFRYPDRPMKPILPTIFDYFVHKMMDTEDGKVQSLILDISGRERYYCLTSNYIRAAEGAILVYDITDRSSFESLRGRWMTRIKAYVPSDNFPMLLVGTKSDLEAKRMVSQERALQFCAEYGMEMIETSVKNGENGEKVVKAFEKLIEVVHTNSLEAGSIENKDGGRETNETARDMFSVIEVVHTNSLEAGSIDNKDGGRETNETARDMFSGTGDKEACTRLRVFILCVALYLLLLMLLLLQISYCDSKNS